jgi:patatin-like phospholipase/acyl hydrolase
VKLEQGSKRFQILALDGGGIKGLYSAAVLANVEADLNIKIADHFDLIVGTSTGGIIALALGIGLSPKEVVEFYVKYGPQIFPCGFLPKVRQLFRNKFSNSKLQHSLIECFGDQTLGDAIKRLVIPSFNAEENSVHLFKTPHHPRLRRDLKIPIWQIAMATSAAPTFFPIFRGVSNLRLIDGGVWANNPSMVGVVEAVSMLGVNLESIHILNLGTTREMKHRPDNLDFGGFWQWKKDAVDLILDGQSVGAYTQCCHLLGENHVYRLNPTVPKDMYAMDKLNVENLTAKAYHESRVFAPIFEERYKSHIAPIYVPLQPTKEKI